MLFLKFVVITLLTLDLFTILLLLKRPTVLLSHIEKDQPASLKNKDLVPSWATVILINSIYAKFVWQICSAVFFERQTKDAKAEDTKYTKLLFCTFVHIGYFNRIINLWPLFLPIKPPFLFFVESGISVMKPRQSRVCYCKNCSKIIYFRWTTSFG